MTRANILKYLNFEKQTSYENLFNKYWYSPYAPLNIQALAIKIFKIANGWSLQNAYGYNKVFPSEKSKKKIFFRDCDLSCIKLYISVAILWKK